MNQSEAENEAATAYVQSESVNIFNGKAQDVSNSFRIEHGERKRDSIDSSI